MEWVVLIIVSLFLYQKLSGLDERLKRLEGQQMPVPVPPEKGDEKNEEELMFDKPRVLDIAKGEEEKDDLSMERFFAWFARDWPLKTGAGLVILGFGWLITYAFLNNWIGPAGRITLGLVGGSAILWGGHAWLKRERHQGLVIELLGTAIVLVTVYAAQNAYQMFPPLVAMVFAVMPMFLLAYSSLVYNDRWLALAGLVTGGMAPLLVNAPESNIFNLYGYLTALVVGTLWLSKYKDWNRLTAASILIVSLYSMQYFFQSSDYLLSRLTPKDLLQLRFFSVTLVSLFFFSNVSALLNIKQARNGHLLTALLIGLFSLGWISSLVPAEWQGLLAIMEGLVFCGAVFYVYQKSENPYPVYIYSANALLLLTAGSAYEFEGPALVMVLAMMAAVVPIVSLKWLGRSVGLATLWYFVLPILLSLENFTGSIWNQGIWHNSFYSLLSVTAALGVVAWHLYTNKDKILELKSKFGEQMEVDEDHLRIVVNTMLILSASYGLGLVWKVFHASIDPEYFARMVTLTLYVIVGLTCYFQGMHLQRSVLKKYGMFLTIGVIVWLLLVELSGMTLVGKILTFLVIGVVLMGSVLLRKRPENESKDNDSKIGRIVSIFAVAIGLSVIAQPVMALPPPTPTGERSQEIMRQFQNYVVIPELNLNIPVVVELPLQSGEAGYNRQGVWESTTRKWQPSQVMTTNVPTWYLLSSDPSVANVRAAADRNPQTFTEFSPTAGEDSQVTLRLNYSKPVRTSVLSLNLPLNVELPKTITLKVLDNNQEKIILNEQRVTSRRISFPQTSAIQWEVTFTYNQILRISEIGFQENNSTRVSRQALRFLARPGESYVVYLSPEKSVNIQTGEAGNLSANDNLLILDQFPRMQNPQFQPPDSDKDGVFDHNDNCVSVANPDQADVNNNRRGDACEDFDQDGVMNIKDNCPDRPNRFQQDEDNDGIGDHCDLEESRLTERFGWLPWTGVLIGLVTVVGVLKTTVKKEEGKEKDKEKKSEKENILEIPKRDGSRTEP